MNTIFSLHTNSRITSLLLLATLFTLPSLTKGQNSSYKLYPYLYDSKPEISSPFYMNDTVETILVITKTQQYGIVQVTQENGSPLLYSYKTGTVLGKDKQMQIDAGDFPNLAKTGLHDEEELVQKKMITGIPIDVINCTAKPNAYSYSGFLADDEDIISVLRCDNLLVKKMGLTHPQLAKPLFHIWNLILKETELGNWARFYDNIKQIQYGSNILNFKAMRTKGWQQSIFFDEIQGRYDIHIERELTSQEVQFLMNKYAKLSKDEFDEMVLKLTVLNFSEMLPYYIM